MKTILMTLALILIAGCSNKATYQNLQINQRNKCLELPQSRYDECMKGVDKSYEEYERERQEYLREREEEMKQQPVYEPEKKSEPESSSEEERKPSDRTEAP